MDCTPENMARAKLMMPLADEVSQAILACSALMGLAMMSEGSARLFIEQADRPINRGDLHEDVTGIFNRRNMGRYRNR